MKLTIRTHNQAFLNQIAAQMECTPAAALDYLLFELKKMNYSFGSQLPTSQAITNSVEQSLQTRPSRHIFDIQPTDDALTRTYLQAIEQIEQPVDPAIERLLAIGLDNF